MATYTYVDLLIPEAELLADLVGIKLDFERAREFAHLMLMHLPAGPLIEPLSIAATVTYFRPFSSGVRYHLGDNDLKILSPKQRRSHDYLRDYRDKHVAHSVNEFEENIPRAQYCVERVKEEGITAITYGSARITSLSGADASSIVELATLFERHVEAKIEEEKNRLLPIVRATPLDEVLKSGQKAFDARSMNVSKTRKRSTSRRTRSKTRRQCD